MLNLFVQVYKVFPSKNSTKNFIYFLHTKLSRRTNLKAIIGLFLSDRFVKMVSHTTKVYARLKREIRGKDLEAYEIIKRKSEVEDIIFIGNGLSNPVQFRFHKVFDQKSCQSEVFDAVAKPVINSVLEGFNGTVFAYGQTGSGKTYTITGSPKNYNDRGIIPRSIQYIFEQNEMISEKPTVYISYMEIYNEVGYDLLSPRQHKTARSLEELPRIALLEDKKGEAHIRNLSVLPVTTEQEAMRLLFLGDTNRTIAETPMNEYSSRSHCIFTIYITQRNSTTNRLRSSKLYLVDLAGSERVSKSLTTGVALHEAKHINLSLHFLQQVIMALSESKRTHIPYRNSIMTFILKDSLSGNCLTAMLATLAISKNNIQETISTCKFAQRVSLITTEPVINEIADPQQEISFLKKTIEELNGQIASLTGFKNITELSKDHKDRCQYEVEKYLQNLDEDKELKIKQPDLKQIQFCFSLLKKEIMSQKSKYDEMKLELEKSNAEVKNLKEVALEKSKEIDTLKNIIDKIPEQPVSLNSCHQSNFHSDGNANISLAKSFEESNNEQDRRLPNRNIHGRVDLIKDFLSIPQNTNTLNFYKRTLEKKLEMAKLFALTIDQCQRNISYIRQNLENCSNHSEKKYLINELEQQQNIYRKALIDLKEVQKETFHLESGMKKAEIETENNFRCWLEKYNPDLHPQALITGDKSYRPHSNCCFTNGGISPTTGHPSVQNQKEYCTCFSPPKYCPVSCNASEKNTPFYVDRLNHVDTSGNYNFHVLPSEERHDLEYVSRSCAIFSNKKEKYVKPNANNIRGTNANCHVSLPSSDNCSCVSFESGNGFENAPSKCGFYSGKKKGCHSLVRSLDILKNNDNHVSRQATENCTCNLSQRNIPIESKNEYSCNVCKGEYDIQPNSRCSVLNVSNIHQDTHDNDCFQNKKLHCMSSECNIVYPTINGVAPSEMMKEPQRIIRDCDCTNEVRPYFYLSNSVDAEHGNVTDIDEYTENESCSGTVPLGNLPPGDYFEKTDTNEFREFMKSVSLSGDADVDKEIFCFYRSKFC